MGVTTAVASGGWGDFFGDEFDLRPLVSLVRFPGADRQVTDAHGAHPFGDRFGDVFCEVAPDNDVVEVSVAVDPTCRLLSSGCSRRR